MLLHEGGIFISLRVSPTPFDLWHNVAKGELAMLYQEEEQIKGTWVVSDLHLQGDDCKKIPGLPLTACLGPCTYLSWAPDYQWCKMSHS